MILAAEKYACFIKLSIKAARLEVHVVISQLFLSFFLFCLMYTKQVNSLIITGLNSSSQFLPFLCFMLRFTDSLDLDSINCG